MGRSVADLAESEDSAEGVDGGTPHQHVVLVGMMGAGKTTVGKRAATLLDRPFVDADAELVRRSGRSVADWFAHDGEPAFRRAESDLLADLLDRPAGTIVAAGGGVVVEARNRSRLRRPDPFVIWLYADPAFLAARVARKKHRPLIGADPATTLINLADEREAWYADVADAVIDVVPVHSQAERPKWVLAERVVAAIRAHEAARAVGR